jgi:hypothetical protein
VLIQIRVSGDKMENEQAVFQNAEIVAELCVQNWWNVNMKGHIF